MGTNTSIEILAKITILENLSKTIFLAHNQSFWHKRSQLPFRTDTGNQFQITGVTDLMKYWHT